MRECNLWQAYQDTFFKFADHPLPDWQEFAIITACNPLSCPLSKEENTARQQRLKSRFRACKLEFVPVRAGNVDFSYSEPSFAVCSSLPDAIALAREFEQNAIYWIETSRLCLQPVLMKGYTTVDLGSFIGRITTRTPRAY